MSSRRCTDIGSCFRLFPRDEIRIAEHRAASVAFPILLCVGTLSGARRGCCRMPSRTPCTPRSSCGQLSFATTGALGGQGNPNSVRLTPIPYSGTLINARLPRRSSGAFPRVGRPSLEYKAANSTNLNQEDCRWKFGEKSTERGFQNEPRSTQGGARFSDHDHAWTHQLFHVLRLQASRTRQPSSPSAIRIPHPLTAAASGT